KGIIGNIARRVCELALETRPGGRPGSGISAADPPRLGGEGDEPRNGNLVPVMSRRTLHAANRPTEQTSACCSFLSQQSSCSDCSS
ncbi:unnamed protein product, partial [Amoebophrya sp. A25]